MILVGLVQADIRFFHPEFHKREMTLLSSQNAVQDDFEHVIRSLEEGRATVDPFLTHLSIVGSLLAFFATQPFRERLEKKELLPFAAPSAESFVAHMQELFTRGLAAGPGGHDGP